MNVKIRHAFDTWRGMFVKSTQTLPEHAYWTRCQNVLSFAAKKVHGQSYWNMHLEYRKFECVILVYIYIILEWLVWYFCFQTAWNFKSHAVQIIGVIFCTHCSRWCEERFEGACSCKLRWNLQCQFTVLPPGDYTSLAGSVWILMSPRWPLISGWHHFVKVRMPVLLAPTWRQTFRVSGDKIPLLCPQSLSTLSPPVLVHSFIRPSIQPLCALFLCQVGGHTGYGHWGGRLHIPAIFYPDGWIRFPVLYSHA